MERKKPIGSDRPYKYTFGFSLGIMAFVAVFSMGYLYQGCDPKEISSKTPSKIENIISSPEENYRTTPPSSENYRENISLQQ